VIKQLFVLNVSEIIMNETASSFVYLVDSFDM